LDLSFFRFVSIHVPSSMGPNEERAVIESIQRFPDWKWPLILHPDTVVDFSLWHELGELVCVENMDQRKSTGRTEQELSSIFEKLPHAGFCFDIGHAWQVDPTMSEAYWILKSYRKRLVQVHVSEVNSRSKHDVLSYTTIQSFREVAEMIPPGIPLILETPVQREEMQQEIYKARFALRLAESVHLVA